jgi:hypothetical protein
VKPQKNSPQPVTRAIRLKPSVTDYATFVATTSKVLGTTGPASRKTKPNQLVLAVANSFNKALVPNAGAARPAMLSVTLARHCLFTLTPAPAVGTA